MDERTLPADKLTLARWLTVDMRKMSAYQIELDSAFDVVSAIGVVHHLADPLLALRQMTRAANPGGKVMIRVDGYENYAWIALVRSPAEPGMRTPADRRHASPLAVSDCPRWTLLRLGFGRIAHFNLLRKISFRHMCSIVFGQMMPRIA